MSAAPSVAPRVRPAGPAVYADRANPPNRRDQRGTPFLTAGRRRRWCRRPRLSRRAIRGQTLDREWPAASPGCTATRGDIPVEFYPGVVGSSTSWARRRLPLPALHWLPLDKEHSRQPAFAERLLEDAEGPIRQEHQQHDEVAGERFLEARTKEFAERGGDRLAVEEADDGFLDDGHDYRQNQQAQRLT